MLSIALYDSGCDSFLDLFEKTQLYFTAVDSKKYAISCFSELELLLAYKTQFDIYIMDIGDVEHQQVGLIAVEQIHKTFPKAKIIYICDTNKHENHAYANGGCAYLTKPISAEKLYNCFDKIIDTLRPERALIPVSGLEDEVILVEEIAYVDIEGRNLCFHFKDGSKVTSVSIRSAFTKEVAKFINIKELFFATTTLLVNLNYIKGFGKNKIIFKNGQELYTTEKAIKLIKEEMKPFK